MITFPSILFPVDFSEQCLALVPAVKAMSRRFRSELTVLHSIDLPPVAFGPAEAAAWATLINSDRIRAEGRISLARFVQDNFPGERVGMELREGDAAHSIAEYAEENHTGLIMMPTHGYGPFRALLLGSVAAKVLHDAHCPVWTGVHAEEAAAHPPDRWHRMVCALDAGPRDLELLRWAACFAAEQKAELRLVHAVSGAGTSLTEETDPSMYEFLFNVARERIAKLQSQAGTDFEVCILGTSVSHAVRQSALGHRADLVLIGRGVIQQPFGRLRSDAYAIIREAPCPVLSL